MKKNPGRKERRRLLKQSGHDPKLQRVLRLQQLREAAEDTRLKAGLEKRVIPELPDSLDSEGPLSIH